MLPAREQIALEIKNAILASEIKAGTELIQEKIADTLGVSRMPVREAFLILERDRFISFVNGRKAIVREFSNDDVIEHYELRALLEGEAAKKAAFLQTDTSKLEAYHATMIETQNSSDFREQNKLFHEEIWELSGGRRIKDLIETLWAHIPPVVMNIAPGCDERSTKEHAIILEAIKNKNSELASEAMKKHIMRSMQDYLDHKAYLKSNNN